MNARPLACRFGCRNLGAGSLGRSAGRDRRCAKGARRARRAAAASVSSRTAPGRCLLRDAQRPPCRSDAGARGRRPRAALSVAILARASCRDLARRARLLSRPLFRRDDIIDPARARWSNSATGLTPPLRCASASRSCSRMPIMRTSRRPIARSRLRNERRRLRDRADPQRTWRGPLRPRDLKAPGASRARAPFCARSG